MTAFGFCDVAAESRYTSGWPWISWSRIGKSCLIRSGSSGSPSAVAGEASGGSKRTSRRAIPAGPGSSRSSPVPWPRTHAYRATTASPSRRVPRTSISSSGPCSAYAARIASWPTNRGMPRPTNSSSPSGANRPIIGSQSRVRTPWLKSATYVATSPVATSGRASVVISSASAARGRRLRLERDHERLVGQVRLQPVLAEDRAVALLLEAQRQLLAAGRHDPPRREHVDEVGLDVVEQPLVVGDQQDTHVRVELRVDALGDDPERVDVEPRVGLVEDRELRLEHRHLQH